MVGWHHRLNRQEFEQALGVGDGQGSLVCYSPWGGKESDITKQLNNSKDEVTERLRKLSRSQSCGEAESCFDHTP